MEGQAKNAQSAQVLVIRLDSDASVVAELLKPSKNIFSKATPPPPHPSYRISVSTSQYLELLSEHEDLLQLLAQQDVVRKKLLNALQVRSTGGDCCNTPSTHIHPYGFFCGKRVL